MEIEGKGILEKREEFYVFEIEIKNKVRFVTALKMKIYDFTIEYLEFQDSEFYNNLESLLVQWDLLTKKDDFYIKTIYINDEKAFLEKKKLHNLYSTLNGNICNFKIHSQTYEENLYKNLLKKEEENRITSKKIKNCITSLIVNEGFLDNNSYYKKFKVKIFNSDEFLKIDKSVYDALSLFDNKKKNNKSVFGYISFFVKTKMGKRVLKQWICQPSKKMDEIFYRLKTVKMYLNNKELLRILSSFFEILPDIDKILVKFLRFNNGMRNSASLKDCFQIYLFVRTLQEVIPKIDNFKKSSSENFLLSVLTDIVKDLEECADFIEKSIDLEKIEERNEFYINPEFSESLKDLNNQINKRNRQLERLRSELQEEFSEDIKKVNKMKIGTVFEIKKNKAHSYFKKSKIKFNIVTTRKTTITFTFSELQILNEELSELHSLFEEEQKKFTEKILTFVASFYDAIETTNFIFIEQDILMAFASLHENPKDDNIFCLPKFIDRNTISPNYQKLNIKNCWHLCVDGCINNSINLERSNTEIILITGPNMGGKSTFIRKVALCVLLAHIGCPVPAKECELTIFSSIFTRVGASDAQIKGVSTFMNEMVETSNMINSADQFSLMIIDELGRGTSIYEGLGISQAITNFIAIKINCFCLFATHFFELTKLDQRFKTLKNFSMEALERNGELILTYKLKENPVDKSYGIQILKNLNFPQEVLEDAERTIKDLEDMKM